MATLAKPKSVATNKHLAKAVKAPQSLDARQAVSNAVEYFREFFPLHAKSNLLLEELEQTSDHKSWLVTLGYDMPYQQPLRTILGDGAPARGYKIFTVNSTNGEVLSVKIRKV